MKTLPIGRNILLGIAGVLITQMASYAVSFGFLADQAVPDGIDTGVASTKNISGLDGVIDHVSVSLNLSGRGAGGWNGDLYVTLVHDSGFAVLLNRPGKNASHSLGYDDNGFDITLDDLALGDIHKYRDPAASPGGPVTGIWQPDGRNTDPDLVTDTDARKELLANFTGLSANGDWTLFVADLAYDNSFQLNSWGLNITTTPAPSSSVPEGGVAGLGGATMLVTLLLGGRFGRTKSRESLSN